MKFTIYDWSIGRVLRWGECPDEAVPIQANEPGEAVIEGEFPAGQFYWDGLQMVAFPPKPYGHSWDWSTKAWVPAMSQAQDAKWEEIKAAREAALVAPLATPYGTFDADPASRANITQTAQLMQTQAQAFQPTVVPTVDFTLADNTVVTLTAGDMVNVALLLAAQIQSAYARGRALRTAIAAATSTEELAAISWDAS